MDIDHPATLDSEPIYAEGGLCARRGAARSGARTRAAGRAKLGLLNEYRKGEHPRWGSRRIRLVMLRKPGPWIGANLVVPSERTIDRLLLRKGLLRARPRKRPRHSYVRFERITAVESSRSG